MNQHETYTPWYKPYLTQLEEYKALADNWDGYHAPPLNPSALDDAKRFLEESPPPPEDVRIHMAPLSSGGVMIEIDRHTGSRLRTVQLDFPGAEQFEWFWTQWDTNGYYPYDGGEGSFEQLPIPALYRWLTDDGPPVEGEVADDRRALGVLDGRNEGVS